MSRLRTLPLALILLTSLGIPTPLLSATFKVGALVPEGTSWANYLQDMVKEIKDKTEGRVKIKLWLGGSAGDEPDLLRKIRNNQYHGGIFTGKALGDVYGDIRLMELPFNFVDDRQKALATLKAMQGHFDSGLESQGFKGLGFFELGKVYIVSKKDAKDVASLKGIKIWAWEGDELVKSIMNELKLVSVPLALPDVLTSLSTGMIDAAYATPQAIIALQWQSKVKYLFDLPVTYSFGGLLLSQKAWKKVKPEDQTLVQTIAAKWIKQINDDTITVQNPKSLAVLKKSATVKAFPKSDVELGKKVREAVLCQLKGKLFSPKGVELFNKTMGAAPKCK